MTSILSRNKNLKQPVKKTREEYAEDALYREVWEDVNNEKTEQFLKKYWRYIVGAALGVMIIVCGIQIGTRMHYASKMATARAHEEALANMDAGALAGLSKNTGGATADLALFQSYLIDKDIKLSLVDANGKSIALTFDAESGNYVSKNVLTAGVDYFLSVKNSNEKKQNIDYNIDINLA